MPPLLMKCRFVLTSLKTGLENIQAWYYSIRPGRRYSNLWTVNVFTKVFHVIRAPVWDKENNIEIPAVVKQMYCGTPAITTTVDKELLFTLHLNSKEMWLGCVTESCPHWQQRRTHWRHYWSWCWHWTPGSDSPS